ncbi:MAG: hypothetical protein DI535_07965 [Citrobacter freundii]|nr:MAG: hypothetical protein DI535_07965 [Citrobacter freundii]
MEKLNIFISSTYYDLSVTRDILHNALSEIGHKPILHENGGVFYSPGDHTHVSCIKQVEEADIFIILIGSRFGGESISDVFSHIDIDDLKNKTNYKDYFKEHNKYSITQCEYLKAMEKGIPIIAFSEKALLEKKHWYEKLKKKGKVDIKQVDFFDDEKENKHAPDIFEFMKFISHRTENNAITPFEKVDDILNYSKEYLSKYFRSVLHPAEKQSDEEYELFPKKFPLDRVFDYFFEDSNRRKSIQSVETRIEFDEKGHCKYDARIKVTPIDELNHYHYQMYSDKEGKVKVNEYRIIGEPNKTDYLGIKKGRHLRLNLFFKEPMKETFTVHINLKVDNYISDLVENGKGTLLRKLSNGLKEISQIKEELIFPDAPIYRMLRVKVVDHPEGTQKNRYLKPKFLDGKKHYSVKFSKKDKSTFKKNTQLDLYLKH